jgi:hypothetical protein
MPEVVKDKMPQGDVAAQKALGLIRQTGVKRQANLMNSAQLKMHFKSELVAQQRLQTQFKR